MPDELIRKISGRIVDELYAAAVVEVKGMTAQQRDDLLHLCETLERSNEFSRRTGAHIVRAAILLTKE